MDIQTACSRGAGRVSDNATNSLFSRWLHPPYPPTTRPKHPNTPDLSRGSLRAVAPAFLVPANRPAYLKGWPHDSRRRPVPLACVTLLDGSCSEQLIVCPGYSVCNTQQIASIRARPQLMLFTTRRSPIVGCGLVRDAAEEPPPGRRSQCDVVSCTEEIGTKADATTKSAVLCVARLPSLLLLQQCTENIHGRR